MARLPDGTKPLTRGVIHRWAFYLYILLSAIVLYISRPGIPRFSMAIYLVTLVNLYGVSSVLHLTPWVCEKAEMRMSRIDYASIFLLIAGSYSPICLNCMPGSAFPWVMRLLLLEWTIAIAGVIKSIAWPDCPRWLNVGLYFICGLIIIPYMPLIVRVMHWQQWIMFIIGGALYLLGGVIYGSRKPDPWPKVFGYHEIFHLLTVIANLFFLVPMLYCVVPGTSFHESSVSL